MSLLTLAFLEVPIIEGVICAAVGCHSKDCENNKNCRDNFARILGKFKAGDDGKALMNSPNHSTAEDRDKKG